MIHHKPVNKLHVILSVILGAAFLLSGCNVIGGISQPTATQLPAISQAEVVFQVEIPSYSGDQPTIALDVLDEVTGLALNYTRYEMQSIDATHYFIRLPLGIGTVTKYRYVRLGGDTPAIEYTSANTQVRYRLYQTTGAVIVQDKVAGWINQPYSGQTGNLEGQVISTQNQPVPNVMIAVAGMSTITNSEGKFEIDSVPVGQHNLVAYSLDGSVQTFQQGAVIAAGAVTPAVFQVAPTQTVKVTFYVDLPKEDNNYQGVPIRLIGNILPLGNTFADLDGGLSTVASRAPVLSTADNNYYSVTLSLPVGLDLTYKYSLGDGFWNAERTSQGQFEVRELIVPSSDATVMDHVASWTAGGYEPITFNVTAPSSTPSTDTVSIQFNPYGWTEPIPMWSQGNNQWSYILYGPLDVVGSTYYRFCRNDQCGSADDAASIGPAWMPAFAQTSSFTPEKTAQTVQYTIAQWAWSNWQQTSLTLPQSVAARTNFSAGVEISPNYNPNWMPYFAQTLKDVQSLGANWIILTPTWSLTNPSTPTMAAVPGSDPLWSEVSGMVTLAKQWGFKVALYPSIHLGADAATWWQASTRDDSWWQNWFDQYHSFVINFGDLAHQMNADALILGGPSLYPTLPNGTLANGSSSGVPAFAADDWNNLLADAKSHFSGKLVWALSIPDGLKQTPAFFSQFDAFYMLWSSPLVTSGQTVNTQATYNTFASQLGNDVNTFHQQFNKPVWMGLNYPSASGAASGCAASANNGCTAFFLLQRPNADIPGTTLNVQEQTDIYQGAFMALNQFSWIDGFFSQGYYPPVGLIDKSSSVHGKATENVLRYWFPALTGTAAQ
ncbi:MAG: hypothetical protein ABSA51_05810 [Anaerolineaceae bacterium]|jgi:hypothetical protein